MDAQQHVLNVSACPVNSGLKQHLFKFVRLKHEMVASSWGDIYATSQTRYEGGGCGGGIKCNKPNEASAARASVAVPSGLGETLFCFSISTYTSLYTSDKFSGEGICCHLEGHNIHFR